MLGDDFRSRHVRLFSNELLHIYNVERLYVPRCQRKAASLEKADHMSRDAETHPKPWQKSYVNKLFTSWHSTLALTDLINHHEFSNRSILLSSTLRCLHSPTTILLTSPKLLFRKQQNTSSLYSNLPKPLQIRLQQAATSWRHKNSSQEQSRPQL